MEHKNILKLFNQPLHIVNVGLQGFAVDLMKQDIPVTHLEWQPPAGGNPETAELLAKLESGEAKKRTARANNEALERMISADPVLVDVIPAAEAIPELKDRMILHAGPPIGWDRMCGPMRGAP